MSLLMFPMIASSPSRSRTSFTTDRKSTRLNSSHANISYAVFCLKKKKIQSMDMPRPIYQGRHKQRQSDCPLKHYHLSTRSHIYSPTRQIPCLLSIESIVTHVDSP